MDDILKFDDWRRKPPSLRRRYRICDTSTRSLMAEYELQLLREETRRLRELVIQLSKMAIKNAVNTK
jgi:hypothetical protein